MTTWYQRSPDGHDTHRGVLARGQVHTDCELTFPAREAVRLTSPPAPERVCPGCDRR